MERRGDDWFGPALDRTARLASLAHGGEVVVSDAVRALLIDVPLGAVALMDLGVHPLHGLTTPEHVWQAVAPGPPSEFVPLRAQRSMPVDGSTHIVGRHRERAVLERVVRAGFRAPWASL